MVPPEIYCIAVHLYDSETKETRSFSEIEDSRRAQYFARAWALVEALAKDGYAVQPTGEA